MKKNLKTLLVALIIIPFMSVMIACDNNGNEISQTSVTSDTSGKTKLPSPTGLYVANKTLSWNQVTDASGYKVQIDNDSKDTQENTYSLASLISPATYLLKVMAVGTGDYTNSDWSATYNYIVSDTVPVTYMITWLDGNGDMIETDNNVASGTIPTYDGETPIKYEDADFTYTFNGEWSPEITAVTSDQTYTAQFDATPKQPVELEKLSAPSVEFIDGAGLSLDDFVRITDVDDRATSVDVTVNNIAVTLEQIVDDIYEATVTDLDLEPGDDAITVRATATAEGFEDSDTIEIVADNHEYIDGGEVVIATVSYANGKFTVNGMDDTKANYIATYDGETVSLSTNSYTPVDPENGDVFSIKTTGKTTTSNSGYTHTVYSGTGSNSATVSGIKDNATAEKPTVIYDDENKQFVVTNNEDAATWENYTFTFAGETVVATDGVYSIASFIDELGEDDDGESFTFVATINSFESETTIYSQNSESAIFTYGYVAPLPAGVKVFDDIVSEEMLQNALVDTIETDSEGVTHVIMDETINSWEKAASMQTINGGYVVGSLTEEEIKLFSWNKYRLIQLEDLDSGLYTEGVSAEYIAALYERYNSLTPPADFVQWGLGDQYPDIMGANMWSPVTALGDPVNDEPGSFGEYLKDKIVIKISGIEDEDIEVVKAKYLSIYDPINGEDGNVWFKDLGTNTSGTLGLVVAIQYSVEGYGEFYAKLDLTLDYSGEPFASSGAAFLADESIGNRYLMQIWENSTVTDFRKQTTLESYMREEELGYDVIFTGDIVQLGQKNAELGLEVAPDRFQWGARIIGISTSHNTSQNWSYFRLDVYDYSNSEIIGGNTVDRPRSFFVNVYLPPYASSQSLGSSYSQNHSNEYMKELVPTAYGDEDDDYKNTILSMVLPNPDEFLIGDGLGL